MSYTSPSPSLISGNGQTTTWWIPATNYGIVTGTGVSVTLEFEPANGLALFTYVAPSGTTFNPTTGVWNIGTLLPGEANTKWLKVVTTVADTGLAPFTLTSTITGNGIDPNNVNNVLVQTLTFTAASPVAGAIDDTNVCACGNVSDNDTACSHGVTEYRLVALSVTNSTNYTFNVNTGEYRFAYVDPSLPITFEYKIWCDVGSGFVEVSGPATVTIAPIIEDISIFDHQPGFINGVDLTVEQIATLKTQPEYATLTTEQIQALCWNVLFNGLDVLVGGWGYDCDESQNTKTFFECSAEDCEDIVNPCPSCPQGSLPSDVLANIDGYVLDGYEIQLGDSVFVQHPNAQAAYTWNGTQWVKWSCGCIFKISQDAGNILTLGTDNAPYLSADIIIDATDEKARVSVNDTTSGFLNGKLVAGSGIILTENNDGANETLTIAATAPASSNVQAVDTPSINTTVSGTGTLVDPFLVSSAYNDGGPTPRYAPGTPGSTGNTFDVSLLFGMPCAGSYTATYTLNGFSTDVYDPGTITLVGTTLTYDILETAPTGTHYINIQRICA
jgi:Domain of unknown function DUF11